MLREKRIERKLNWGKPSKPSILVRYGAIRLAG